MTRKIEPKQRFAGRNLKCSICGELAENCPSFYVKQMLCNRHYLQIKRHGEVISTDLILVQVPDEMKICDICGDTQSPFYRYWKENDEYKGKILCSKHYKMLKTKGYIYDPMANTYMKKEERICDKCFSTNDVIFSPMFQGYFCRKCYTYMHHQKQKPRVQKSRLPKNDYLKGRDFSYIFFDNDEGDILVDTEDLDMLLQYKWHKASGGYAMSSTHKNGKHIQMQRLILNAKENEIIDHINRNPLDNRKNNLRIVTKSENAMNSKLSKKNKTGIKGVCWNNQLQKWRAYINKNGIHEELGHYNNFEEAVYIRLKREKELFGEYSSQQHLYEQYGVI